MRRAKKALHESVDSCDREAMFNKLILVEEAVLEAVINWVTASVKSALD